MAGTFDHPRKSTLLTRSLSRIPVVALVVAGAILTFSTARIVSELDRDRTLAEFHRRGASRLESLRRNVAKSLEYVRAVGGLYDASDEVSREEFDEFARPLLRGRSGVKGIAWVPGDTNPFRSPPTHVVANGPVKGFLDLAPESETAVRTVLEAAQQSGRLTAAGPVRLQGSDGPAYVLVRPVYRRPGEATYSLTGSETEGAGLLACEILIPELLRDALGHPSDGLTVFAVIDVTWPSKPAVLFGRPDEHEAPCDVGRAAQILQFGDRTWRADCRMDPAAVPGSTSVQERLVLLGGLLLTGLAAALLELLGRTSRIAAVGRRQSAELKAANAELAREIAVREEAEFRYRSLVENAIFGIFRSTPDGRILDVNPALVAMLGYESADEVRTLNLHRDVYADPEDRARIIRDFDSGTLSQSVDVLWKRRDGETLWARLTGRAVRDPDGRIVTFETLAEDVTEKVLYEEQVKRARRVESIGRLAGGIAHDFNNLLTVILAHSWELRDDEELPEDARRKLREVARSGERAADLTRQLLAFGRQQVLKPRPVDVNRVVDESAGLLSRLMREDIAMETDLSPDLATIRVDPAQLGQVVMNLALNARDAMPDGGRITICTRNVEVRTGESVGEMHEAGRFVLLSIRDTGVGMDPETRAHIFDPFFTTKEERGGNGLGLSTVYGIVKQSGGWIWVASEPGGGSTFDLYFPRCEEAAESGPAEESESKRTTGNSTILVAEDEDDVRELACEALALRGYEVLEARNGRDAWRIFTEEESRIDGLVTDMVMPHLGGAELTRRVRERRADVGILCVSGYSSQAVACHGAPSRGTQFLEKPFDLDELATRLQQAIDEARTRPHPETRTESPA